MNGVRRRWARSREASDEGSVTAELALALPTLVLVLALGIWLQSAVALHARCLDAARAGARAVVRGDPDAMVRARLAAVLPAGAAVVIGHGGGQVMVTVQARVGLPPGVAALVTAPAISATASSPDEAAPDPAGP